MLKFRKNDFLLIGIVLLFAGLLWLAVRPSGAGAYVVVSDTEGEVLRVPLDQPFRTTLTTEEGGYNILVIEDGAAFLQEANCGDLTCVRTGKISRSGEKIVCLPHRFVIEIVGEDDAVLDATTR